MAEIKIDIDRLVEILPKEDKRIWEEIKFFLAYARKCKNQKTKRRLGKHCLKLLRSW